MTDAESLSVVVERDLAFPPEKVWRALTQPHLIEEWLMKNDFAPVVGHRFNLQRTPKPDVNIVIDCEVRIVEPILDMRPNTKQQTRFAVVEAGPVRVGQLIGEGSRKQAQGRVG